MIWPTAAAPILAASLARISSCVWFCPREKASILLQARESTGFQGAGFTPSAVISTGRAPPWASRKAFTPSA